MERSGSQISLCVLLALCCDARTGRQSAREGVPATQPPQPRPRRLPMVRAGRCSGCETRQCASEPRIAPVVGCRCRRCPRCRAQQLASAAGGPKQPDARGGAWRDTSCHMGWRFNAIIAGAVATPKPHCRSRSVGGSGAAASRRGVTTVTGVAVSFGLRRRYSCARSRAIVQNGVHMQRHVQRGQWCAEPRKPSSSAELLPSRSAQCVQQLAVLTAAANSASSFPCPPRWPRPRRRWRPHHWWRPRHQWRLPHQWCPRRWWRRRRLWPPPPGACSRGPALAAEEAEQGHGR